MREFAHPPTTGARREIATVGNVSSFTDHKGKWNDFVLRVDTIQKCGLIAEVTADNGYVMLYATRRSAKVRRG